MAPDSVKRAWTWLAAAAAAVWIASAPAAAAAAESRQELIYNPGALKPIDSRLKVKAGERAPVFSLPAVSGAKVSLAAYRGRKNVVLSFVPAAFTPVCSDQWPGYNMARPLFESHDAELIGISVDNIPTLYAWTRQMGELWFPVLSDFWPHGAVAGRYGLLRSDGTSERALVFIDKQGVIRDILVSDINRRPDLEAVVKAMEKFR
jgi:peroxiredoxin (alkyl hydroperoxide reductase subunit C)